jgi:aspartate kinase
MSSRVVMKFGGSSVSSVEKMRALAHKIIARKQAKDELVIVVSAMGKTTDQLIQLAHEASSTPSKRELDLLLSTGEQVSIALFTMVLRDLGYPAIGLTGTQAGIKTKGIHTKTKIEDIDVSRVQKHLAEGSIVLVAGFQGVNDVGDITTLGRGGSDTSAIALAAKLGCAAEIYTDVSGIYGIDPRRYPNAKQLITISYEEMKELAWLGAKVMEPRSIEIAQRFKVPVYVAHAHEDRVGTWIQEVSNTMEHSSITGVSVNEKVLMVNVRHLPRPSRTMAQLFERLAEVDINVDMISQTIQHDQTIDLAFTTSNEDITLLQKVLAEVQADYPQAETSIDTDCVKVSVVGEGMRTQAGVAASLFVLLSQNDIEFKLVTTSEISISYTLASKDQATAVRLIAERFDL